MTPPLGAPSAPWSCRAAGAWPMPAHPALPPGPADILVAGVRRAELAQALAVHDSLDHPREVAHPGIPAERVPAARLRRAEPQPHHGSGVAGTTAARDPWR